MTTPTTLYSLYQLEIVSGNIYTSAQMKFKNRSGELTELDKTIRFGTIANVKKLSSRKSCPSWHKLIVRGSTLFEILFKTRNLNHYGKGKFNRREEECLLILKNNHLNIFVFKNPAALSSCISNPAYWHNYWPYTCSEKQQLYAPIPKEERVERKFLTNDVGISNDIDFLTKHLTTLTITNPAKIPFQTPQEL